LRGAAGSENSATGYRLTACPTEGIICLTELRFAILALADKIINPDLEKWYYARAHKERGYSSVSHSLQLSGVCPACQKSTPNRKSKKT